MLFLDAFVVAVIPIFNRLLLEVLGLVQVEQFSFKQTKEIFHNVIVQTIAISTYTLSEAFLSEYRLVDFLLELPELVGVQEQSYVIGDLSKVFSSVELPYS